MRLPVSRRKALFIAMQYRGERDQAIRERDDLERRLHTANAIIFTLRKRLHRQAGGLQACEGGRYCNICMKPLEVTKR